MKNGSACPLFVNCEPEQNAGCSLRYNGVACGYVEVSFGLLGTFALVYTAIQVIRALFQTK